MSTPPYIPSIPELFDYLAHEFENLPASRVTAVISIPAPPAPLSAFLRAMERDMGVLWDSGGSDEVFAGAGVAHRIDLHGPGRFTQLSAELAALWNQLVVRAYPDVVPRPPRVFGGFAFHPGSATAPPWEDFGDGCFVLPRWCYSRLGATAVLSLAVRTDECDLRRREALFAELELIRDALDAERGIKTNVPPLLAPSIQPSQVHQIDYRSWDAQVEAIRTAIHDGHFSKVVAARRCDVQLEQRLDDIEVLSRLAKEPNCSRFAFRRKEASFLGASPELLFNKKGRQLTTQALAGTLRSLGSESPQMHLGSNLLLDSDKDRSEHEYVVQEICSNLEPFTVEINAPAKPQIRKVRNILHLNTPIEAVLRENVDPTALVGALHPTPAVGGLPKTEAADWVVHHEQYARGWYSAPVGWIDAAGDASFVVAIRSGLIQPRCAHVFTGAGIIATSNPPAEYEETELKQLPLLRALGVII